MSEKTKIEFNAVEAAREGVANLALSAMAVAATVGLFPHMGEKQAVTVTANSSAVQDETNFMRREKDEYHQQFTHDSLRKVQGRTKDV